jgi:IS30 family transposase
MGRKSFRPSWYSFYRQQKSNARMRKIGFYLTSEEWWKIWQDSGHWHERGRLSHQYCMARFGDRGHYILGNVEITTTRNNNIVGSTGRKHSQITIKKMKKTHKGVQYRPHKLNRKQALEAKRLFDSGINVVEIARQFGVGKSTIYRSIYRL